MMRPKLFTGLLCLVVGAGAAAGIVAKSRSHAAAAARQREVYRIDKSGKTPDDKPPWIVQDLAAPSGVLAIRATAPVQAWDLTDRRVWWFLEIRRKVITPEGGLSSEVVGFHEYRDRAVVLAAGHGLNAEFAERLEMPPGKYEIWLEARDSLPHVDLDGAPVQDFSPLHGKLFEVVVR